MKKNQINTPESVIPLKNLDFDSIESFYQHIPYEGSLGILALGSLGLLLWRKKRAEIEAKSIKDREKSANG